LRRALLAALVLAACGKGDTSASLPPGTHPPQEEPPHVALPAEVIPPETQQLVTAIVPDWNATTTELRFYERAGGSAPWKLVMGPWPGVVGKGGTGWGMGRHGRGPYPNRTGPLKQEGDGRSPAGAFLLQGSYGYADRATAGVPYQPVDASWKCVDDPRSARYNTILDERTVKPDWSSAEEMRRSDELYTWVVDIAHNPTRIPNGGSCIFLHVWGGPDSATVGCTAMEEPQLAKLIGALSSSRQPMFVLLPKSEYAALTPVWGLPAP
jgi:L,D-peptidoglycan transpeptidase YkuD (ErfK/YbiS/YcfS/YnhG family)